MHPGTDPATDEVTAWDHRAGPQLVVSAVTGAVAGAVAGFFTVWSCAWLVGWITAASVFLAWVWRNILRLDSSATRRLAMAEDPNRASADLILIAASVSILVGAALTVVHSSHSKGTGAAVLLSVAVAAVAASWATVPTVFTLRYARLYYEEMGGLDFHQEGSAAPTYLDFAYMAFTVGMTFQVSDTEVNSSRIRAAVLRQSLLSYLFGVVIVAATINVVAGFFKG